MRTHRSQQNSLIRLLLDNKFLSFVLSVVILISVTLSFPSSSQAISTGEMPIGSIIQMSGMNFVKVTSNCLFVGLESYDGAKRVVIDYGASTSLVAPTIATGQVCSWEDSNNNLASPHSCTTLVYPTVTTTYQLTVTYGTSSSTYLYQVVVNSPSSTPTTYTINLGNTQTFTTPTVISTQTCTWNPSTYLSNTTTCSPTATPTVAGTTAYTVTLSTGHQFSYLLVTTPTTFQTMTASYCNYMTPCTIGANCSTNGSTLTLTDTRDSKTYQIRKFADGNCWMIDNLKYGGDTDAIAGKTTFSGNGQTTPYITWYSGSVQLYGDARDPAVPPYCTESDSCPDPDFCANHNCGYYYSWQAAVQNSLAYSGNIYQPTEPVTGICPSGWQLPTNFGQSSFINLHSAMGFTANKIDGTDNWTCITGCTNFWQQSDLWAGLFSGDLGSTGNIYNQGGSGYFWTSTQYSDIYSYYMAYGSVKSYPVYAIDKGDGFSVRCVL